MPPMKNSPKEARKRRSTIRLWTYNQAKSAAPYIASVVRSLREHALEAQSQQALLNRLAGLALRPNRNTLIATQDAQSALARANDEQDSAARELAELDVVSVDPMQGTALVPFVQDDQLAWYVFDLFDAGHYRFWRFQSDPESTRRRLTPSMMR
jgi:hypothetical protein